MKEKMICRGDLFYYDFGDNSGSVQSGERPVLVVQADDYNQNAPTIIVAAVTSVIKKRYHLQSEKTDVISVMEMVGIMLLPTGIHPRKKRGGAMTENKIIIPIWKKSNLTVEEAAAYCGIGSRKLREMSDSEFCPFVLWNGSKRLIKRRKLDEYLDNAYSI